MLRKLLLPLLPIAALALAGTPAQAAAPGINIAGAPGPAELDVAKATGAKTIRLFVHWSGAEPTKGDVQAKGWADIAAGAGQRGLKVVYVIVGTPAWANGGQGENVPPTDPQDMANFVEQFAAAPGNRGNVAGYEIWNEQDEDQFWSGDPASRPAKYASIVNVVGPAIRRGDPEAKAILGPTTGNNYGFLQSLYDSGLDKGAYDAIAVHTDTACLDRGPYDFYKDAGRIARFTFLGYREVRATALANGDDKPIWMTELGWTTTGDAKCERGMWAGKKPSGVSTADQATFLKQAYNCLQEDQYVTVAQWFTLRDNPSAPIEELKHYGLYGANGQAKPSLAAFRQVAGDADFDVLDEACGDFSGPAVKIAAPTNGQKFHSTLYIRASATGGVARLSFYADGTKIRNFTGTASQDGKPVELLWQGAKKLANGPHTITVEGIDAAGNSVKSSVQVVKAPKNQIASTIASQLTVGKKVSCKGRTCTVSGRATSALQPVLDGKVQLLWQLKQKGGWKTLHKATKAASKSFNVRQKVRKAGRWRVSIRYLGDAPFKASKTVVKQFRVR
ncbi:Ig-like domain-containing protein [Conexibacter sp. SYSU D00693]|uniref:Ig-like domain-containing protein n=1 Tax=Conexibacter sp. SYSU D00693 TaxID=2812560 RepID=UPI00196A4FC2|nr:Ig-like domain-containing protein [Conexibacter sp. SYSU D00693]